MSTRFLTERVDLEVAINNLTEAIKSYMDSEEFHELNEEQFHDIYNAMRLAESLTPMKLAIGRLLDIVLKDKEEEI